MKPLLIALEGADGAGRTRQVRLLADWLEQRGRPVRALRLKGSELLREGLRRLQRRNDVSPRSLFLLYAADLADLVHHEVEPALREGRIVLCDRYLLTPIARVAVRGIDPEWARAVLEFAPRPDLTLVLHASARRRVARLLERRRFLQSRETGQGEDCRTDVLTQTLRYQRRLARVYTQLCDGAGGQRIDADRDELSVHAQVCRAVSGLVRDGERELVAEGLRE